MELSASSAWARLVRGTMSMLIAVMPCAASRSVSSGVWRGCRKVISTAPRRIRDSCCSSGSFTPSTMSLDHTVRASATRAPAAWKAASDALDPSPAPYSTTTS